MRPYFELALTVLVISSCLIRGPLVAAQPAGPASPDDAAAQTVAREFREQVQPFLAKHCVRCHNADNRKSGVRVDQLTATADDQQIGLLSGIRSQLSEKAMPPEDEPQPTEAERRQVVDWIERVTIAAQTRQRDRNGSIRRLTVAQYRNTLGELLGLREDLTDTLPPDAVSKEGFTNHDRTLLLSPLLLETYFDVARQALDRVIVDEKAKPQIQTFRMEFGAAINAQPCPDRLILGANSDLLANQDFVVTQPTPTKPFAFDPIAMRTKFDFIEGYAGNDTVRGWRKYDSIYHAVFACVRGTPGYPKGEPNQVLQDGLALRPAIPSSEIFGRSNTYGPMANFKISLRELPDAGDFRITVKAARYEDGLLLEAGASLAPRESPHGELSFATAEEARRAAVDLPAEGVYQVEATVAPGAAKSLSLQLGSRSFTGTLFEPAKPAAGEAPPSERDISFLVVRLPAGKLPVAAAYGDPARLKKLTFTLLPDDHAHARRFVVFEKRAPSLGVHVGLRRDCGSTLTRVGLPQRVSTTELQDYAFFGAIADFPSPDVERDNVNYLAGIREIGVRSEFTDGRDMPRLLVRSIEFEGPYYTQWPPESHRRIFIESDQKGDPAAYAREVLQAFSGRAFRRPASQDEVDKLWAVWNASFSETQDFARSIKDALLVALTSPQFLFLIEASAGPQSEDLDQYELASKLSYFLWNGPPDERLLQRAARGELHVALDEELDRMTADARFERFVDEFATQWLNLEKFDVLSIDGDRFPRITRDVKAELRREPVEYLKHALRQNLSVRALVKSDFVVANEAVASYYRLGDRVESGFEFQPIRHERSDLGGLLSQAGILAGLSDGRESNPVKRGAWLARKIVARPPADPPPNVPQIKEDDGSKLTLREKLERHRNQEGCAKCHQGIDPWGLPFERYDASGVYRADGPIDARSTLPDGTEVDGLPALQNYLSGPQCDQVAYSFLKHAATYAVGRTLSYNEQVFLRAEAAKFASRDYRLLDMIRFVVHSDVFLKK
ncbi:MAG: DUF1592 domain-containing protein [Pirellulales bacterium]